MSALPKSPNGSDAPTPFTETVPSDGQPHLTDDAGAALSGTDSVPSHVDPDGRDDGPDGEGRGPEASKFDPDDAKPDPDGRDRDPDAATGDPDAADRHPDGKTYASLQAPRAATVPVPVIEPSGWADMAVGPQAQFAVIGTEVQSVTFKMTTAAKEKKVSDRKPKAPATPPAGGEAEGDGGATPINGPPNDEAPSGPESRNPRVELSIPPGLEGHLRVAGGAVRDQLVKDPHERYELVKAVVCVATKPNWRSIAAQACDLDSADGKVEKTCAELLTIASEGHDKAIDRAAQFTSRLRKDPTAVVAWYDIARDACLMTLGNQVLRRGGLIQRLLQRAFPKLRWKEAADRRAKWDKQAEAKKAAEAAR